MSRLDSLLVLNWPWILICVTAVLYFLTALAFILKKDYPSFLIFVGYVIANIGFMLR